MIKKRQDTFSVTSIGGGSSWSMYIVTSVSKRHSITIRQFALFSLVILFNWMNEHGSVQDEEKKCKQNRVFLHQPCWFVCIYSSDVDSVATHTWWETITRTIFQENLESSIEDLSQSLSRAICLMMALYGPFLDDECSWRSLSINVPLVSFLFVVLFVCLLHVCVFVSVQTRFDLKTKAQLKQATSLDKTCNRAFANKSIWQRWHPSLLRDAKLIFTMTFKHDQQWTTNERNSSHVRFPNTI
jgi:hypothetical protein